VRAAWIRRLRSASTGAPLAKKRRGSFEGWRIVRPLGPPSTRSAARRSRIVSLDVTAGDDVAFGLPKREVTSDPRMLPPLHW